MHNAYNFTTAWLALTTGVDIVATLELDNDFAKWLRRVIPEAKERAE